MMEPFHEQMAVFKEQLVKGHIQVAYQGLMAYFRHLRSHFADAYPEFTVPTTLYYGYMDMTYFAVIPPSLKRHKLKIAIVFTYETYQFEVFLSGANRRVQAKFWDLIKERGWDLYPLSPDPKTHDYIVGLALVSDPDFRDLDALTRQIETGTLAFIRDVEAFLAAI